MQRPLLSVLDQSLVRSGSDARTAFAETLAIARAAESLGYARLWVSEHHDSAAIAGSSPEVLLSAIGAATSRIRIGSGGVMLPHYSPYKVAENFAVLSNLYPGRVDLGVGRAPGADMRAAAALAPDGVPRFERFPQQLQALIRALRDPEQRPRVSPARRASGTKTPVHCSMSTWRTNPIWYASPPPSACVISPNARHVRPARSASRRPALHARGRSSPEGVRHDEGH